MMFMSVEMPVDRKALFQDISKDLVVIRAGKEAAVTQYHHQSNADDYHLSVQVLIHVVFKWVYSEGAVVATKPEKGVN